MEKKNGNQKKMENFSREVKNYRTELNRNLRNKNAISKVKNSFDRLMRKQNTVKKKKNK